MDHTYRKYKITVIIVEECASLFPILPAPLLFFFYLMCMEHAHSGNNKKTDLLPYIFQYHISCHYGFHYQSFFPCLAKLCWFTLDMTKYFFMPFTIFILKCFQLVFPCGVSLFWSWERGRIMSKLESFSETGNFLVFLGLFETTVLRCGKIHNA